TNSDPRERNGRSTWESPCGASPAEQPARDRVDGREIEQPEGVEQLTADGPDQRQPPTGGAAAGRLQVLQDAAEDVHHGRPDAGEDSEVDQQDEPADRDGR